CMAFMPDAVVMERARGGEITKLYLPLRPVEAPDAPLAKVVLATNDEKLIALFRELDAVPAADFAAFVDEHRARLQFPIGCRGLVHCGLAGQDDQRAKIQETARDLSEDFVVIEDGQEPSLFVSLILFVPGLLLLLGVIAAAKPAEEAPAAEAAPVSP
ncbi:MAG: hypothetical protein KIS92_24570, partial [Planctomycetota bacterium]|nr:hypothetical protein [Planctomycetota bacterium]